MRRVVFMSLLGVLLGSPVWAATRLAVPSGGSSSGDCTSTACTLARAISQAAPGDTIELASGTYSGSTTINCNSGSQNGTPGTGRITLKATNERQAHLAGTGPAPLQVWNCNYWTFEGLHLSNADSGAIGGAPASVMWLQGVNNVILRRLLVHHTNRYYNAHAIEFYIANNNLVEECEVYDFHRHGIIVQEGDGNTYRRNYVNSRGFTDLPGCNTSQNGTNPYCSNNPAGDSGLMAYPAAHTIMENNISEGNGFGLDMNARFGNSVGNQYFGNMANNNTYGFSLTAGPQPFLSDMPVDSIWENNVSITGGQGNRAFRGRSTKNLQARNNTVIGASAEAGWMLDLDPNGVGDSQPTSFTTNLLVTEPVAVAGAKGISVTGQTSWSLDYVNVFNFATNTPALSDSHITHATTVNPQLGTCVAWIPDSSPMKGAGSGGADIGATILYRYQDGVLTTTPLWDQNSGKFPCGAAVTGVNDVAGSSCFDVHQRLHINTGGCAFPSGYGTVTPPPTPIGNFATYTFDENTGTTAGDSSGQGHNMTLSSAGWGAPIIGVASLATDGTRYASFPLAAGLVPSTTAGLVGWWNGTTPATCDLVSLGDSVVVRINSNGTASGFFYNGSGWPTVSSSPVNVFDGQNHMAWMTKSPTELRVGVDTAVLNTIPVTGTITYIPGSQGTIGKHGNGGGFVCPTGRIDMVRLFDTELTPTAIINLYNEQAPTAGLSVTHVGWFAANAPEGVSVGATDSNVNQLINAPIGVRWSIHKADPGTLTEYFRPFCRVLDALGALVLDWTEITNSFGSTGIRFYADSVVTTGTPTSVLLPTDGFVGASGLYLDNPVDISSPYDAVQRVTISQGQSVDYEMKVEFGSPRIATERLECRPQRENGAPFTTYMGSLP